MTLNDYFMHVTLGFRARCFTQSIRLSKPNKKSKWIDVHNQGRKWRRMNVVLSVRIIRLVRIFDGVP